jgi:hypothetical protein
VLGRDSETSGSGAGVLASLGDESEENVPVLLEECGPELVSTTHGRTLAMEEQSSTDYSDGSSWCADANKDHPPRGNASVTWTGPIENTVPGRRIEKRLIRKDS